MRELIFATNNAHKVAEVQGAIGDRIKIISLRQAGIEIDIPEPFETLEQNAHQKVLTIFQLTGKPCFSEDTGLEVEALGGEPGVRTARYSGELANDDQNIEKLLKNMEGVLNRKARFRTVISLIMEKEPIIFEGICEGTIAAKARGDQGFGYDPIFSPDGSGKTFAEMSLSGKSQFSHRRKASDKLVLYLLNLP